MGKIALFGAAGATGKSIAATLRARGIPYRVVGRDPKRLAAGFGQDPLAEIVGWNPDDPSSVRAAVLGVDTLVFMVGLPYPQSAQYPPLMRRTLDGAIAAGVRRVLLLGSVYSYGRPRTPRVAETHPREPETIKGRNRRQQEDMVLEAHAAGKIEGAILRLPDFYGPEVGPLSLMHLVFEAVMKRGRAMMIGPIDTPHEFLYVPDLGPVVADLAGHPGAAGRAWNLAGAGSITQREAARQIFALAGQKPKIFAMGKTMLRAAGLFDPTIRELVEMHYLQTTPVLLDDSALTALLGPLAKTPYAEGIRETYEAYVRRQATVEKAGLIPHVRERAQAPR